MLEAVGRGNNRMPGANFLVLQPVNWPLLFLFLFFIISHFSRLTVSAQMGAPKGNSPLYNSRPYSPPTPSGLPQAPQDPALGIVSSGRWSSAYLYS